MKILMICNTDGALYNFRKPIIEELVKQGHEVHSITSSSSPEGSYLERLQALGVKTHIVEFDNSVGMFNNLSLYSQISKQIKIIKPDIVHNFTHKPAIFGTLAARFNGVKKIFISITGLGNLFTNDDLKTKILRNILLLQYRVVSRFVNVAFFQNPDDINDFVNKNIIMLEKTRLTPGSGINVNEFKSSAEEKLQYRKLLAEEIGCNLENKIILLCPARALHEKGINEFYNTSKIVNKLSDNYIFIHLGSESHQAGMDKSSLEKKAKENNLYYLGYKSNIQDYMTASDVVVLPSYYREGVPRSLLEALALDKYILTTNRPGCKEVVINDWNGKLFEAKNHKDLASKVLAVSFEILQAIEGNSRKFAENFFDSKIIVEMTLCEYGVIN
jgi:N,N'-diacetylbacillosaminyl-diphospho-undecaprenol alpha-1,3-N-acetylgalactosaminyltransferase